MKPHPLSPLPWFYSAQSNSVQDALGKFVMDCNHIVIGNRRFMVRAANSHTKLVEALEVAQHELQMNGMTSIGRTNALNTIAEALEDAKKATTEREG